MSPPPLASVLKRTRVWRTAHSCGSLSLLHRDFVFISKACVTCVSDVPGSPGTPHLLVTRLLALRWHAQPRFIVCVAECTAGVAQRMAQPSYSQVCGLTDLSRNHLCNHWRSARLLFWILRDFRTHGLRLPLGLHGLFWTTCVMAPVEGTRVLRRAGIKRCQLWWFRKVGCGRQLCCFVRHWLRATRQQ